MKKGTRLREEWLNLLVGLQKRVIGCKKGLRRIGKEMRPYLAPRFWAIYIVAFTIGFYLWGPFHGVRQIGNWHFHKKNPAQTVSVEALQREINRLKRELQTDQAVKTAAQFTAAQFGIPIPGNVGQGFEWIYQVDSWRQHAGVDIQAPTGTEVLSAAAGTVESVTESGGDFMVTISHGNGWESRYGSLREVTITPGQYLIKGAVIGKSGNNGCIRKRPGIHFGIFHNGHALDPLKIISGLTMND